MLNLGVVSDNGLSPDVNVTSNIGSETDLRSCSDKAGALNEGVLFDESTVFDVNLAFNNHRTGQTLGHAWADLGHQLFHPLFQIDQSLPRKFATFKKERFGFTLGIEEVV